MVVGTPFLPQGLQVLRATCIFLLIKKFAFLGLLPIADFIDISALYFWHLPFLEGNSIPLNSGHLRVLFLSLWRYKDCLLSLGQINSIYSMGRSNLCIPKASQQSSTLAIITEPRLWPSGNIESMKWIKFSKLYL